MRSSTLIIATPNDGAVDFAHAQALADTIPRARLITSHCDSHMIWFADDYPAIADTITTFLPQQRPQRLRWQVEV